MDVRTVYHIARAELVITIRNRWTIIFAIVFGGLVASIAYFGVIAEGFSGLQSFTRTSASLLNLVLYIVPLVALIMGTLSFTGDKGAMELLYSQPLSRSEVNLGKLLGLFISISLSTLIGFTLAGGIILAGAGPEGLLRYLMFVLLSLALSLVFLGIAVLVATLNRRKSRAFGVSLFLWFFFVLFYDLIALGGTLLLKGQSGNVFLFISLFGNPVDMVRVSTLILLENITIFGAAGAVMLRFLGGEVSSIALLIAGLAVWAVLPVLAANRLMRRQDL